MMGLQVLIGVKKMNFVRNRVGGIKISEKVSLIRPYKMEGSCEEELSDKEVVQSYFNRFLDKGKAFCYFVCI